MFINIYIIYRKNLKNKKKHLQTFAGALLNDIKLVVLC